MNKFTKIFAYGHPAIRDILDGPYVEISEKIDGSQFRFYKDEDDLIHTYSKGSEIFHSTTDNLFKPAVDYINEISDRINQGFYFYGETLYRPKHNTIKYDRIPKNHIALFGVYNVREESYMDYEDMMFIADEFNIDIVPLIKHGRIKTIEGLLDTESYLGGHKIEGFVVRDVHRAVNYKGIIFPMMLAKYVSEEFKEKHIKGWKQKSGKSGWETFMEQYKTEARWQKGFQHLRDQGDLEFEPRDIGKLIKEVQRDITEECKEEILNFLWDQFGKNLLRYSIRGLPEWYKEKIAKGDY
jgi:hypothetical protein